MIREKGISLIAIIITILVILIISSITIYTGLNMIDKTKEKAALEKMKVIYDAIIRDELAINMSEDSIVDRVLNINDYEILGLDTKTYNNDIQVIVNKSTINNGDFTKTIIYYFQIAKNKDLNSYYEYTNSYSRNIGVYVPAPRFDTAKGVNMPQLSADMIAVTIDEEGNVSTVNDVYKDNWYNYNKSILKWANAELNGKLYVWLPRFAYKIQNYYRNTGTPIVPASAIDIVFLREDTNNLATGDSLPEGYLVHPAFTFGNIELAGIWVSKDPQGTATSVEEAYFAVNEIITNEIRRDSHLMKNTEWGAIAYLSHYSGIYNDYYSTGNVYGIKEMNSVEFVSAYLADLESYKLLSIGGGIIELDRRYVDAYDYTEEDNFYNDNIYKYGDAMIETSSGDEDSAWFSSISNPPDSDNPFIIRVGSESYFGYDSSDGILDNIQYRNVLVLYSGIPSNE